MNFNQWFSKRYPRLREAAEFGMLGGTELVLFEAVKEAFAAGQQNASDDYDNQRAPLGNEQIDS
jgi:hypothetical protein